MAFGATNKAVLDLLGVKGGPLYKATRARLLYLAAQRPAVFRKEHPTPETLVLKGACDAMKLFIKNEPHHKRKADLRKWRLIFNLSLLDQLVDRMLFGNLYNADAADWPKADSQVGIGFSEEQIKTFLEHINEQVLEGDQMLEGDFSGWDWSVEEQDLQFDCAVTLDRYDDGEIGLSQSFFNAVCNRYHCVANKMVAFSDGTYVSMLFWTLAGVMPSGWLMTALCNSRVAACVLRRIARAAGTPLRMVKTMGDDNISSGPKLPSAEKAIELAVWFGKRLSDVKHHPRGMDEGFEFCSQYWALPATCRPSWPKMLFGALGKEPTVDRVFALKMEFSRLDEPLRGQLSQLLSNVGWDVVNNIAQMRKAAAKNKPKMGGSAVTQPRPKKSAPIGHSSKPAAAVVAKQKRFTAGSPQIDRRKDGSIRVVHKEYVTDLLGSTSNFVVLTTLQINPGLSSVFPWLSQLAALFEGYRFHRLRFSYETDAPTSAGGTQMMAMDYDAADNVPTTKQEILSMRGAVKAATWENFTFSANPKDMYTMGPRKYVRTTTLTGVDIKTYDVGNFFQAAGGQASSALVYGELFVEYDVELFDPQTNTSNLSAVNPFNAVLLKLATISGLDNASDFGWNGAGWQYPFGTKQDSTGGGPQPMGAATGLLNAGSPNPLAGSGLCAQNGIAGTVLNIVEAGEYLLEMNYNGNFTSGSPTVTVTGSSGVTINSSDAGASTGTWFGTASGSALKLGLYIALNTNFNGQTLGNWINVSTTGSTGVLIGGIILRLIRCFRTFAQVLNSTPIVDAKRHPAPLPDDSGNMFVVSNDPALAGKKPLTVAAINNMIIHGHPLADAIRADLLSRVQKTSAASARVSHSESIPLLSTCALCRVVITHYDDGSKAEPFVTRCAEHKDAHAAPSAAAESSDFQFHDVSPSPLRVPMKVHYHQGATCPKCILSRIEYADGTFGGVSREFCRECTAKRFSGDLVAGQKVTITSDGREDMPLGDHVWSREWGKH